MKVTLTFDSMKEMENFCREVVNGENADSASATQTVSQQTVPQIPINNVIPTGMPSIQQPVVPVPAQQVQMPTTQAIPQQAVAPVQSPVPTTAVAQEFSYDQLAVAAAGLMNAGKAAQLHAILQRFGVQAMTELAKERYSEFATAIRAEGAVI